MWAHFRRSPPVAVSGQLQEEPEIRLLWNERCTMSKGIACGCRRIILETHPTAFSFAFREASLAKNLCNLFRIKLYWLRSGKEMQKRDYEDRS